MSLPIRPVRTLRLPVLSGLAALLAALSLALPGAAHADPWHRRPPTFRFVQGPGYARPYVWGASSGSFAPRGFAWGSSFARSCDRNESDFRVHRRAPRAFSGGFDPWRAHRQQGGRHLVIRFDD